LAVHAAAEGRSRRPLQDANHSKTCRKAPPPL